MRGITREEYDVVKTMIRASAPWWYLLELPNGQWGALWVQGLGGDHAWGILDGDYGGLAFVGTQEETQKYILLELDNMDEKYLKHLKVKPTKRIFQNVRPGRQARVPKWENL